MRILTIVSPSLDADDTVRIKDGKVDLSTSRLALDKMDEYGVEEALRLRDAGLEAEIIAVAAGQASAQSAVRSALDMGADRGVHVIATGEYDVLAIATAIAWVAKEENADLIFIGGQQANRDSQAVGGATAALLEWPQVTWVNELELSGRTLRGRHDVDRGSERFEVALPALVTTQQGLNEPRYPTLPNIRKSRMKELHQVPIETLGICAKVRTVSASLASRERLRRIVDGKDAPAAARQIVDFLRNEAKVIA